MGGLQGLSVGDGAEVIAVARRGNRGEVDLHAFMRGGLALSLLNEKTTARK
jgi:hypothetical protein